MFIPTVLTKYFIKTDIKSINIFVKNFVLIFSFKY